KAQNELVLLLGKEHQNVCVVGDSDQSVYRFRGADIRNILEFEEAFPAATMVVLEQNYRSTQTILDAANAVIANNLMRKPKALWTEQVGGELIQRYYAEDETDEAGWVAHEIARLHDAERYRWGDVAIFYRTNAQSRLLDELRAVDGGPGPVLEAALERTGYAVELERAHDIESQGRLENLAELVGVARDYESTPEFLEAVSLVADADEIDDDDTKVVLM